MKHITDVVIVGGGAIGTAIAYYLRKLQVDTTLLEREEIGSQASSAAAGLLAPLGPLSGPGPFADLLLSSFALFPSLVPELEEASNLVLEYEHVGALRTVSNLKRIANLKKRMLSWEPLGLQMYWLTGEEARQREPHLGPEVCAAIYVPQESQIQASQIPKAFAKAASYLGANILTYAEVVDLRKDGNKITGVHLAPGETISCNHLVLAPGAWAALYGKWLNLHLPVSPLRGQMLLLQGTTSPLKHIIFGNAAYMAPKGDKVLVGATKEDVGFDAQVTEEGISWLYETATKIVPSLGKSQRRSAWAGLRPSTPDKWPILGPAPHWENVTLATGHNSVGIMLSAITGKTIAELVATGHTPEIIRPFSLERFKTSER